MITFIISSSILISPFQLRGVDPTIHLELQQQRIEQYKKHVPIIIDFAKSIGARAIVVENNGCRHTIFNSMDCEVLYTDSNLLNTGNKGTKEYLDIQAVIHHFNIPDDELIVKVTGRYLIDTEGPFCSTLHTYNPETTDCIIRYGWFGDLTNNEPHADCLTGLIAMKCRYLKNLNHKFTEDSCIEHAWGAKSLEIPLERRIILKDKVGYKMYEWNDTEQGYQDL